RGIEAVGWRQLDGEANGPGNGNRLLVDVDGGGSRHVQAAGGCEIWTKSSSTIGASPGKLGSAGSGSPGAWRRSPTAVTTMTSRDRGSTTHTARTPAPRYHCAFSRSCASPSYRPATSTASTGGTHRKPPSYAPTSARRKTAASAPRESSPSRMPASFVPTTNSRSARTQLPSVTTTSRAA